MITRLDAVASGATPLVAVTAKPYVPAVVGTPESTPLGAKANPGGSEPLLTENDGVGDPEAENV